MSRSPQEQGGMVLPALAALFAVAAGAWLLSGLGSAAATQLARELRSAQALALAREALIGYAATYRKIHPTADFGYLPCPDLDGDGSSETCGNKNMNSLGRLPYLTLGLADLRDGDGECLWYAVAGSFKNNPKPDVLNWDSSGRFRVLDAAGRQVFLAGDQAGLAAAVVFAPGAPLPGQTRHAGSGRCGGDLSASSSAQYLEAIGSVSGSGEISVRRAPGLTNNDRIATLTGGDIVAQTKTNPAFAPFLQSVIAASASCLAGLPAPLTIESSGLVQLGRVPTPGASSGLCNSASLKEASGNWREVMRYARCSDGSACLATTGHACRGVLLFGGERIPGSQRRVDSSDKLVTSRYLEASTLAALATRQLGALPATFTAGRRGQAASADVAVCIP